MRLKSLLFVFTTLSLLHGCSHSGTKRGPSLAGVPIEERLLSLAECGRGMQILTPVVNGLPFGDTGAQVLAGTLIYRHFPEDGEDRILLIHGPNLYRVTFPALGLYAPGGNQVSDTLEFRMDGGSYYILRDVVGSIGTAFDLQKRPLNPRAVEQSIDEPALRWFTKKLKAATGKTYLEAELLDPTSRTPGLQAALSELAEEMALSLSYLIRDRYARDESLLQKAYDAIDSAGCARLPELDLTRLEWKARVQKAAERVNRPRR